MEVRQIRAFVAVAHTLHFSKAAKNLHISQPTLSLQIQQLEEEIGVKLVQRSTRMVRLTDAGWAIMPLMKNIMESLEQAAAVARSAETVRLASQIPAA